MRAPSFLLLATLAAGCRGLLGIEGASVEIDAAATDAAPDALPADPMLIPGGGIRNGPLAGRLHVYVINAATQTVLANTTVFVETSPNILSTAKTDATGLVSFEIDPALAKVNVGVVSTDLANAYWIGVAGTNVTIPLHGKTVQNVPSASLEGSITNLAALGNTGANHTKQGRIASSRLDTAPEERSALSDGTCEGASTCAFAQRVPLGAVEVLATIVNHNNKGTPDNANDDVYELAGYATRRNLVVVAGTTLSDVSVAVIAPATYATVTAQFGTSPLGTPSGFVGIETERGELRTSATLSPAMSSVKVPSLETFAPATYRFTATASGSGTESSSTVVRGITGTTMTVPGWLPSPKIETATRTSATLTAPAAATIVTLDYRVPVGSLFFNSELGLAVMVFDDTRSIALPETLQLADDDAPFGMLTTAMAGARHGAIDVTNFSFSEDGARFDQRSTSATKTVP